MKKNLLSGSAAVAAVLVLAACGQSDGASGDEPAPAEDVTVTSTLTETGHAGSGDAAGDSGDGTKKADASGSSGASDSADASGSSGASGSPDASGSDPDDFGDTEEVDAVMYTAQGGSSAGTSFTTEDGSVACHITGVAAACVVTDNQATWDESDRANDGLAGTGAPLNTVGWDPALGADFGAAPKTWTQQGEFPTRDGVPLDNGSRISVTVDSRTTVECAVRDNTVTCKDGHGSFTVSKTGLAIRD